MVLEQLARVGRQAWSPRAADPVAPVARACLAVEIRVAGVELDGTTLDVGETGLLVAVRTRGQAPAADTRLQVRIPLPTGTVDAEAELVRRAGRGRDVDEWALRFTRLPHAARRLVRTHVFAALRDHRSHGLL